MPKTAYTFKIGGEAGFGIMSAGATFNKLAVRSGFHTFDYVEYPSLVRGGHNVMQVTFCAEPVFSQYAQTDFLIALNQETVDLHKSELVAGSGVLYDASTSSMQKISCDSLPAGANAFPIPLTDLAREAGVSMVMRNTIALGAAIVLLGGDLDLLKQIIAEEFADKSEEIIRLNHEACDAGAEYVKANFNDKMRDLMTLGGTPTPQLIVTGNEAAALGAIASGMNFAAIYPMTPTSNILHNLAPYQEEYGFIYKQPEDEISAINMAIGAAHAGARPMVATSGGGFCLMSEGLGLAGLAELPVVIFEGMRGSPATGIPTWTEQGDLKFVLSAHQGDFPRIVLTPGDVEEVFHMSMQAFNLAEKYQTPVIVLIDKHVCESHLSVKPFEYEEFKLDRGKFTMAAVENYERFGLSEDGISLRSAPGTANHFVSNSDEHDPEGYSNEEIENRNAQMQKRMQKLVTCAKEDMADPVLYGPEVADVTFVSWGSNKGAILEALDQVDNANYLHITWANPFPVEKVSAVLKSAKHVVNVECNYSAQMGSLIREKTGILIEDNFLKYDGRPFYPGELVEKVRSITE